MNIFSMFNTGKQGLFASQYEMNIVEQNLANAGTEGYSKQKVSKEATVPYPGIDITKVYRSVDAILERRINQVTQDYKYYDKLENSLSQIESYLNEIKDGGITQRLDEFWNAWQELADEAATPPSDTAAPSPVRINLIQSAKNLATAIQDRYRGIYETGETLRRDIGFSLRKVNKLLSDVAEYNEAISKTDRPEKEASELKDRRQKVLNELAELLDITYTEQPDKTVTVYGPSGSLLVSGNTYWMLARHVSSNGYVSIYWMTGKEPLRIEPAKGKLAAQLKVNNEAIPKYLAYLDGIAKAIISSVNSIHRTGFSVNGTTGLNFFKGAGASDMTVDDTVASNPNLIATSSKIYEEGNNETALKIVALKDTKVMANGSFTINEYTAQMVSQIGIEVKDAKDTKSIKNSILSSLKEKRSSVSEVNKDEELAKIMLLEKQFQAASKVITVADTLLQTVINMVR
jgi:flagellar hook-associated protein 1 FlgK